MRENTGLQKSRQFYEGSKWNTDDSFLPTRIPRARIMVYGYDAIPAFRKSREGIQEWVINLLELLTMERDVLNKSFLK